MVKRTKNKGAVLLLVIVLLMTVSTSMLILSFATRTILFQSQQVIKNAEDINQQVGEILLLPQEK